MTATALTVPAPTGTNVTALARHLLDFAGDDNALAAEIKATLVPSDELITPSAALADLLAPLQRRGDQVCNAVADFFDGVEALKKAHDEEQNAFYEMEDKVRASYCYRDDWSIGEYRKFKKGGGSAAPKETGAQGDDSGTGDNQKGDGGKDEGTVMVLHQLTSPIRFVARLKDHSSSTFGLVVSIKGKDDQWREVVIDQSELYGKGEAWVTRLVAKGLSIQGTTAQLRVILNTINPTKEILTREQGGWFETEEGGHAYMLPSAVAFTPNGTQREYRYGGDREIGAKYQTAGTLEDWKREVAGLAVGNSRLVLAISASLSAMLLKPLGLENFGFHFHGSSSLGKTKALTMAASVYGGPRYTGSLNTTQNALENRFYAQNDTSTCGDEAGEMRKGFGGAVYMLGNGANKGRMNSEGSSREEKHWRVVGLTTGEKTVEEHMRENGEEPKAGHTVRLINIKADAGKGHGLFENLHGMANGKAFADKLDEVCSKFYGTASTAFAKYLVENYAAVQTLRDKVKAATARLIGLHGLKDDVDGQVHRVASKFALVAVAGELARMAGVVDWNKGEAESAALMLFGEWLVGRGTAGDLEVKLGIDTLLANLETYARTKFDEPTEPHVAAFEKTATSGADNASGQSGGMGLAQYAGVNQGARVECWGFREATKDGTIFYIFKACFTKVCGGRDAKKLLRELADRGWLERGAKDRWTRPKKVGGQSHECYWVRVFSREQTEDGETTGVGLYSPVACDHNGPWLDLEAIPVATASDAGGTVAAA